MTKINQEEYEVLKKKQEKGHKYIAREKEGHVIVFTDYHGKSEYRWLVTINEDDLKYESLFNSSKVFQFIQWEDESPYNIQELIEEYENSPEYVTYISTERTRILSNDLWSKLESEETEVKTLESIREEIWEEMLRLEGKRKDQWADIKYQTLREVLQKLRHLDEPEVLSQEWIDEHKKRKFFDFDEYRTEVILVEDLQNLLVPKQEEVEEGRVRLIVGFDGGTESYYATDIGDALDFLTDYDARFTVSKEPVIPNYVAKWISEHHESFDLYPALRRLEEGSTRDYDAYKWYRENTRNFVNAYLTGEYEIEQEPEYYAKIKGHENIASNDKYWNYNTDMEELSIGDSEVHPNVISEYMLKATKEEWANLGINDDNADFVKVEELEE